VTRQPASLIVPVENQVRELDPKLLVACAAVERGFQVFLGSRTRVDFRIATFPRSIYLSKGMTPKSAKMFRIMRKLGHEVAALDEEGLVYHTADEYYARRISPQTLEQIATLFAWGEEGAALLRNHTDYSDTPLYVTGSIRDRLGRYILVNTNFSKVNAYFPRMNLLVPAPTSDRTPELGAAGIGLPRAFAEGLARHKRDIFDHFQAMLPELHAALPEHQIVIRPHPSENREPWKLVAKALDRVHVIHEGNVIPWLAASEALVHNGCTTGIEAFVMQKPAVAYQPVTDEVFDLALPNHLSRRCFDFDELSRTLHAVLADDGPCRHTDEQRRRIDRHLAALEGPLAADRIVDVLAKHAADLADGPPPGAARRLQGWFAATQRSLVKQHIKARVPQHRNNPAYQRNRYEGISLEELRSRVSQLGRCLGRFRDVRVEPVAEHVFLLTAGGTT